MDNIRDKKLIKIKLKQISENSGSFTLSYTDDSSDDFLNIKSTFTYTGKYFVEGKASSLGVNDAFGVGIITTPKGEVLTGEEADLAAEELELEMIASPIKGGKDATGKRSESLVMAGTSPKRGLTKIPEKQPTHHGKNDHGATNNNNTTIAAAPPTTATSTTNTTTITNGKPPTAPRRVSTSISRNVRITKFVTERLTCKLTDGGISSFWTIEPSEKPDCDAHCAWPWEGTLSKMSHTAPADALNFLGQEDIETGSIDLRMRIPQLAAGWNPPVVVLNEMTGWKLDKKSW
jgi:hypothetical protein